MSSLYDELIEKLNKDPRLTRRGGPRIDLALLLFNARDSLNSMWVAADHYLRKHDTKSLEELHDAIERLRPIFGERNRI